MNLFCLTHSSYESSYSHHYTGPEMSQDDFKRLCDSLMPEAAQRCMRLRHEVDDPASICMDDMIEQLDILLLERGFKELEFAEVEYIGTHINESEELLGKETMKLIEKYNDQCESQFRAMIDRCRR